MSENYRVRIKFNNAEIEVESSDRAFVESKLIEYEAKFSLEKNAPILATKTDKAISAPRDSKITTISNRKGQSLQEFVRQVKPKSGTDYAVAIGYYVEQLEGKNYFEAVDVKNGFLAVKFQHSNPSDTIAKAKSTGKIMDGQEKNSYILTQTGEEWVEQRLASTPQPS